MQFTHGLCCEIRGADKLHMCVYANESAAMMAEMPACPAILISLACTDVHGLIS